MQLSWKVLLAINCMFTSADMSFHRGLSNPILYTWPGSGLGIITSVFNYVHVGTTPVSKACQTICTPNNQGAGVVSHLVYQHCKSSTFIPLAPASESSTQQVFL